MNKSGSRVVGDGFSIGHPAQHIVINHCQLVPAGSVKWYRGVGPDIVACFGRPENANATGELELNLRKPLHSSFRLSEQLHGERGLRGITQALKSNKVKTENY